MESDAKNYFKVTSAVSAKASVPAYERILQLYAFGHSYAQISEIITQEFGDIDFNNYSPDIVRNLIKENKQEFDIVRRDLGLKCRDEIQNQTARLFNLVKDKEDLMVDVFAEKLKSCLESLRALDLDELDDDGNYANTSRIFVLTEMAIKLQSHVSRIVGTDALREIEVYAAKARAKQEAQTNTGTGLLPAQESKTTEISTQWM